MALAATPEPAFARPGGVRRRDHGARQRPRQPGGGASQRAALLTAAAASDGPSQPADALADACWPAACAEANAEAVGVAHTLGDPVEPPSCTFVAAVVADDLIAVAWCGDSRARTGCPTTGAQRATDRRPFAGHRDDRAGRTREEAEADPTCHTITRWLGADSIDPTSRSSVALRSTAPGWLLVVQRRPVELRVGDRRARRAASARAQRRRGGVADRDRRIAGRLRQRARWPRQHHGALAPAASRATLSTPDPALP